MIMEHLEKSDPSNMTVQDLVRVRRRIENRLKRNPYLVIVVAKVLKIELPK